MSPVVALETNIPTLKRNDPTRRCLCGLLTVTERLGLERVWVELDAHARRESQASVRLELFHLATAYIRLAEQADRNSHMDIVYETPPPSSGDRLSN